MKRRLLIVGWDGAEPSIILPLLDSGTMPNLASIVEDGCIGTLTALPPLVRSMAWTSLATGRYAPRHGVYGDLEVRADGAGVQQVGHDSWTAPAFWETLTNAGLSVAVVGWPATSPAVSWADATIIDDMFAEPAGLGFDAWTMRPGCVAPTELRQSLRPIRVHPGDIVGEQIAPFVVGGERVDQDSDPRLSQIAVALARTSTVHAAATHIAEHGKWDVLTVVYPFLADIQREFLRYRAPRLSGVSDLEADIYGEVADRAYRFQDMLLRRMLELVGPETTVLVLSPHGYAAGEDRPTARGLPQSVAWHRKHGFLAAIGPGLRSDAVVHGISIVDLAPTILALCGIAADGMDGRVHESLLVEAPGPLRRVTPRERPREPVSETPAAPADAGVNAELSTAQKRAIELTRISSLVNAAEAHLALNEYSEAAQLYERVLELRPGEYLATMRLARCRLHLGNYEGCRALAEQVIAANPVLPWGYILKGAALAFLGEQDKVNETLATAREKGQGMANVTLRLAGIHLLLQQWSQAETLFREFLILRPDSAPAYEGLGCALHGQGKHAEAVDAFRRATGIHYHFPAAHMHLGAALAALGHLKEAADSVRTALAQSPTLSGGKSLLETIERALAERAP